MIRVLNIDTGEVREFHCSTLYVAPNGMVFIKSNGITQWASASPAYSYEKV